MGESGWMGVGGYINIWCWVDGVVGLRVWMVCWWVYKYMVLGLMG